MKYAAMVAVLLTVCACSAFAGDGQISKSALADMGLSGLQVMSDAQGMSVRGSGASVSGTATVGDTTADYDATFPNFATGSAFAAEASIHLHHRHHIHRHRHPNGRRHFHHHHHISKHVHSVSVAYATSTAFGF